MFEQTKAQRGEVTCPGSHSEVGAASHLTATEASSLMHPLTCNTLALAVSPLLAVGWHETGARSPGLGPSSVTTSVTLRKSFPSSGCSCLGSSASFLKWGQAREFGLVLPCPFQWRRLQRSSLSPPSPSDPRASWAAGLGHGDLRQAWLGMGRETEKHHTLCTHRVPHHSPAAAGLLSPTFCNYKQMLTSVIPSHCKKKKKKKMQIFRNEDKNLPVK